MAFAAAVGAVAPAYAGAWTEPAGQGQAFFTFLGWQGNAAPSGGASAKEWEALAESLVEYGVTDRVTGFVQSSVEDYNIGAPTPDDYRGLGYSQVGMRVKLWDFSGFVTSAEGSVFIPGAQNASHPAQNGDTGGAAEARFSIGRSFVVGGLNGFFDAEVAYRDRTAGPPSEWHGDATVGIRPTDKWMAILQSLNTISENDGAPGFPQLKISVLQASLVYALDAHWSVQAGVFDSIYAVGTNTQRGALIAVWRKF